MLNILDLVSGRNIVLGRHHSPAMTRELEAFAWDRHLDSVQCRTSILYVLETQDALKEVLDVEMGKWGVSS